MTLNTAGLAIIAVGLAILLFLWRDLKKEKIKKLGQLNFWFCCSACGKVYSGPAADFIGVKTPCCARDFLFLTCPDCQSAPLALGAKSPPDACGVCGAKLGWQKAAFRAIKKPHYPVWRAVIRNQPKDPSA